MNANLDSLTASALRRALDRLHDLGVDAPTFMLRAGGVPPWTLAGALANENPKACRALMVKALRMLSQEVEQLYKVQP